MNYRVFELDLQSRLAVASLDPFCFQFIIQPGKIQYNGIFQAFFAQDFFTSQEIV